MPIGACVQGTRLERRDKLRLGEAVRKRGIVEYQLVDEYLGRLSGRRLRQAALGKFLRLRLSHAQTEQTAHGSRKDSRKQPPTPHKRNYTRRTRRLQDCRSCGAEVADWLDAGRAEGLCKPQGNLRSPPVPARFRLACRGRRGVVEWRVMARGRTNEKTAEFQRRLLDWFRASRRDLPWRRTRNAYRVWVSEIMLQQTRTAAVLPYYRRFFRAFPSLRALARAREEQVLRAWAGLGYYSRARNLHRAAQIIVREHGGRFPSTLDEALALPGVGDYTARAVLSIACGERLAVLDGNVARVVARREAIEGDLRAPARWKQLQAIADRWLAQGAPGDWNQAMMELGAMVCTPRQPRCGACPVREGCRAFRLGMADRLPERRVKPATVRLHVAAAVLLDERGRTLLIHSPLAAGAPDADRPGDLASIFSRMWHFPALATSGDSRVDLERHLASEFGLGRARWQGLAKLRHTVTFREITIEPWLVLVDTLPQASGTRGVRLDHVRQMAVSGATRKIAAAALAGPAIDG
jgi:A/G-specific adenine glycosylase